MLQIKIMGLGWIAYKYCSQMQSVYLSMCDNIQLHVLGSQECQESSLLHATLGM